MGRAAETYPEPDCQQRANWLNEEEQIQLRSRFAVECQVCWIRIGH